MVIVSIVYFSESGGGMREAGISASLNVCSFVCNVILQMELQ